MRTYQLGKLLGVIENLKDIGTDAADHGRYQAYYPYIFPYLTGNAVLVGIFYNRALYSRSKEYPPEKHIARQRDHCAHFFWLHRSATTEQSTAFFFEAGDLFLLRAPLDKSDTYLAAYYPGGHESINKAIPDTAALRALLLELKNGQFSVP